MKTAEPENPFGAPVYHEETVSSTMDVSRALAQEGAPHGTVIFADFQESGRGRLNRTWVMEKGQNLMFTILFRYPGFSNVPGALTLRAGLAISLALEDFVPALSGSVKIKWPNDIMISSQTSCRKTAGILAEADGSIVLLGVGVNLKQKEFPPELRDKAGSVALALEELALEKKAESAALPGNAREILLGKILLRLYAEFENEKTPPWKERLEERLYKKGEQVSFAEGPADSRRILSGRLEGIGPNGELALMLPGETGPRLFSAGELKLYN